MTKKFGLSASTLRILALGLMLLDHLWGTVVPGSEWMHILGRLAFPIFAFQAAQGYRHTRDFRRYCRRLLVFGLISEIPYDMMLYGTPIFPFQQNVMFTLLLGLQIIRQYDLLREDTSGANLLSRAGKIFLFLMASILLFPDYGYLGVLTVVMFHVMEDLPNPRLAQLAGMVLIHGFGYTGQVIPLLGGAFEVSIQSFAILAMIPIALYNGEKGISSKGFQYFSYAFYPVHMLILALLQ